MDLLERLLGHDAWTTRVLIDRCRDLTDGELDRRFDIGHRTVRATLEHIIFNMETWAALMAAEEVSERPTPRGAVSIEQLTNRLTGAAARLADVSTGVARRSAWDARWLDVLDDPPTEKTYGGAIAHVLTHSMHHRAQLLYMLRQLGLADLPEGDVFSSEHQQAVSPTVAVAHATSNIGGAFLEYSRWKVAEECWPRLRGCVESLTDEQFWWRPNESSNSVGNLVLHLNGNLRQWLVVPFTQGYDARDRQAEFAQRAAVPRMGVLQSLGGTIEDASQILARLTDADLTARFDIQGYSVTGLEAVYQVVEHFTMHYGQIVYVTKLVGGADLGFYRELDASGRVE